MHKASVSLHVLLTLGNHPHAGVGRKASALSGVELVNGDKNTLGSCCKQVIKINASALVLLGDLVSQANVGLNETVTCCVVTLLSTGAESELLGLGKDKGGGGECCKSVKLMLTPSSMSLLRPIYIAGCVPTLAFQPFFLFVE